MNQNITKLAQNLIFLSLLFITACSTLDKPISKTSNTTMRDVATESYTTFKSSVNELKTAFFPDSTSGE